MKKVLYLLLSYTIFCFSFDKQNTASAQSLTKNGIPKRTNSYVNDFTGKMLDTSEIRTLNMRLKAYEDSTSTQIVVICLPKLPQTQSGGIWEIEDLGIEIGREWGIGQEDKNNGILFLVSLDEHKTHIATGYGIEGSLPDIICKRILDEDVQLHFEDENYYEGIDEAITRMERALVGEYVNDKQEEKERFHFWVWFLVGLGICAIVGAISHLGLAALLGAIYAGIYWTFSPYGVLIILLVAIVAGIVSFIAAFFMRISVSGELGSSGSSSGGSSDFSFSSGGGSFGGGGASGSWD